MLLKIFEKSTQQKFQVVTFSIDISFEYKKRLLLRCIHHFKSINNMDHMRISGTEPEITDRKESFYIFTVIEINEHSPDETILV